MHASIHYQECTLILNYCLHWSLTLQLSSVAYLYCLHALITSYIYITYMYVLIINSTLSAAYYMHKLINLILHHITLSVVYCTCIHHWHYRWAIYCPHKDTDHLFTRQYQLHTACMHRQNRDISLSLISDYSMHVLLIIDIALTATVHTTCMYWSLIFNTLSVAYSIWSLIIDITLSAIYTVGYACLDHYCYCTIISCILYIHSVIIDTYWTISHILCAWIDHWDYTISCCIGLHSVHIHCSSQLHYQFHTVYVVGYTIIDH